MYATKISSEKNYIIEKLYLKTMTQNDEQSQNIISETWLSAYLSQTRTSLCQTLTSLCQTLTRLCQTLTSLCQTLTSSQYRDDNKTDVEDMVIMIMNSQIPHWMLSCWVQLWIQRKERIQLFAKLWVPVAAKQNRTNSIISISGIYIESYLAG